MNADDFYGRNRPKNFSELVFASDADRDDLHTYADRRRYDHLLLFGPNGSAKSTTAAILVEERQRAINAPNIMVERFSARDLNGNLEPIMDHVGILLSPGFVGDDEPYVIIEEVDQMTTNNQYDLRMLMDTMRVGKLIMTTNNINDVDKGVRDRSEKFELLHPSPAQWLGRAKSILASEGHSVADDKLLDVLSTASRANATPTIRDMMRILSELSVALGGNAGVIKAPPQKPVGRGRGKSR